MKVHAQNERYSAETVLTNSYLSRPRFTGAAAEVSVRSSRLRADRKWGRFRTGAADAEVHNKPVSLQNPPEKVSLLLS